MSDAPTVPPPCSPADALSTVPLRLDKWLWTARLFRTRALALEAVRGGHVRVDGAVAKPSRLIAPGAQLSIWREGSRRIVLVRATAVRRVPARRVPELYEETPESIARRRQERGERAPRRPDIPAGRPTKRTRRAMGRFLRRP
jgi:ribosome-associated heat shock protein Hsp15